MSEKKVHKRLTIAELRNCKGFENYTDEHAEETIKSLEKLSILFYQLYMKQKQAKEKFLLAKTNNVDVIEENPVSIAKETKIENHKNENIYEGKTANKERNAA